MKRIFLSSLMVLVLLLSCGGGSKKSELTMDKEEEFSNQKALAAASSWRGNFQQALKEINEAEQINDKDPEVYVIKGAIFFGLKDNAKAEQFYKQAIGLNPNYTPAHFNLCGLYLGQNNFDGVIAECSEVVTDPTYKARANAYTNIGIAYFNKGDMTSARENYEKALQINPAFVYAHNELGKLYLASGRYGEAIFEFQQAISGYDTYEEAFYNLGLAYLKTEDNYNACESFRKVVEIAPASEFGVKSNRYLNSVCQ